MRCNDLAQWLDEGMPAAGDAAMRRHAAECAGCARALAAATLIERALSAPPAMPYGRADRFVAGVLARIDEAPAAASSAAPATACAASRPTVGQLWWGVLAEPAFVAGAIALLMIALVPAFLRQDAGHSLAIAGTVAFQALDGVFDRVFAAWFGPLPGIAALEPYARAAVNVCFLALLLWGGHWATGAVDRWFRPGPGRRA
jgi:hypothetical protein